MNNRKGENQNNTGEGRSSFFGRDPKALCGFFSLFAGICGLITFSPALALAAAICGFAEKKAVGIRTGFGKAGTVIGTAVFSAYIIVCAVLLAVLLFVPGASEELAAWLSNGVDALERVVAAAKSAAQG